MNEHKPTQLNIKSAEARELASEIATLRGVSLTEAVVRALRVEATQARRERDRPARLAALIELTRRYAALPDRDTRTADEIIGYDENGLPT